MSRPGFPNPTGPVKPPPSGSSLSDRFDRKPVEFKSKFKIACTTVFDRYTDRFDRFTGRDDRFGNFYFFLNLNLNFELGLVDRFDRFTGQYDRFVNFYFFELGPV